MNAQNAIRMRSAKPEEHAILTDLCLRSKAVWGYNKKFMDLCRSELTLDKTACCSPNLMVAERSTKILGVAEITAIDGACFLERLFVEPDDLSSGVGSVLFNWAKERATQLGYHELVIEADPGAKGFYRKMGAKVVGETASQSIPGRTLPKMILPLNHL